MKNEKNRTYIDNLYSFKNELYKHMTTQKYLSLKRVGGTVKASLWKTEYFNGAHKSRTSYEKSKKGTKHNSSTLRAQTKIFDLIQCNVGEWGYKEIFLTLTYKQELISLSHATEHFTDFIREVKRKTGLKPAYVCVPEFQKRGTPHFHIIFFNMPFMFVSKEVRKKLKTKKSQFDFNWNDLWKHGDVNVKLVRNTYTTNTGVKIYSGFASYMTKYLSKDFKDNRMFGQQTYYSSKNLIRPYKVFIPLDHHTYDTAIHVIDNILGIDEDIETTFYKFDSDFISIEGVDKKGGTNLVKSASGKGYKIENDIDTI